MLMAEWSEEEVKAAFFSMARNKSPGGDGLLKELFECHWDLLGGSFMAMVKDFEVSASLPAELKEAVTILLHKNGDRDQLNNYRPITLLNFTYKVLAKVLADRMKRILHQVISPEQCGFLPGRCLSDAVALVADIIDVAKNEKADRYMLLVDFQKSFDSVSRDFLFQVLRKMGFLEQYVGWIEGLHENTTTKLLVNGWLGEGLNVVSGVRQGCPLAPYLFLCAVEPLAQEVEREKLGLSKKGQQLSYLGFKWAGAEDAERLLGVWVTPSGNGQKTWEKALERIAEKLVKWKQKNEILQERVVFNKNILLRDTTPIGGQKDARKLWDLRLEDLFTSSEAGVLVQKSVAELTELLGSNGPAKLALKAVASLPAGWYRELGFPTVLPCSAASPQLLNVLVDGGIIPMKRMKEGWKEAQKESYKRAKWAARWGESINWKKVVSTWESVWLSSAASRFALTAESRRHWNIAWSSAPEFKWSLQLFGALWAC
ncbi:unnamed protein product [Closterium sp. NIES-65]|nr:unnamed protein product [Closterium sp. NIES-65]